jgi:hypothetical protein
MGKPKGVLVAHGTDGDMRDYGPKKRNAAGGKASVVGHLKNSRINSPSCRQKRPLRSDMNVSGEKALHVPMGKAQHQRTVVKKCVSVVMARNIA